VEVERRLERLFIDLGRNVTNFVPVRAAKIREE